MFLLYCRIFTLVECILSGVSPRSGRATFITFIAHFFSFHAQTETENQRYLDCGNFISTSETFVSPLWLVNLFATYFTATPLSSPRSSTGAQQQKRKSTTSSSFVPAADVSRGNKGSVQTEKEKRTKRAHETRGVPSPKKRGPSTLAVSSDIPAESSREKPKRRRLVKTFKDACPADSVFVSEVYHSLLLLACCFHMLIYSFGAIRYLNQKPLGIDS